MFGYKLVRFTVFDASDKRVGDVNMDIVDLLTLETSLNWKTVLQKTIFDDPVVEAWYPTEFYWLLEGSI